MIYTLPKDEFKKGIQGLLDKHFHPSIAKQFVLEYEAKIFNADNNKSIRAQLRDKNFVLEVRYKNNDITTEFICDVYSWESRERTEAHLLRYITDKYKAGKIGKDWVTDGKMLSRGGDV